MSSTKESPRASRKAAAAKAASEGVGRNSKAHKWEFRARFRRHSFGWKSQPAITRIKQAVSEIKQAARKDKALAAEGAVLFLEKVSPALERVDSSSGSIGIAVNNAITALVRIIVAAPADEPTRQRWLQRLFDAHAADQMSYIESLSDYWGELCGSREVASRWADELVADTRMALSSDNSVQSHFHGTLACLTSLYAAGRYDDLNLPRFGGHPRRDYVPGRSTNGKAKKVHRRIQKGRCAAHVGTRSGDGPAGRQAAGRHVQ